MSKIRLISIAAVLISFVMILALGIKNPSIINLLPKKDDQLPKHADQQNSSPLNPDTLVAGVSDYVAEKVNDTKTSITDTLDDTKEEIAKKVLGEQKDPVTIILPPNPEQIQQEQQEQQNIITVDLSKDSNIVFNLKKQTSYYILFKNVPKNTCLYISSSRYEIESEKLLLIKFDKAGTYNVSINRCDLDYKNIGIFTVEE